MERHLKKLSHMQQHTAPWWDEQAQIDSTARGASDAAPLALVQHEAKGVRISAVGVDGIKAGLHVDMKLNDARAAMPDIQVHGHKIDEDMKTSEALGHWMTRYSPAVAQNGLSDFLIDTTGCDHLFGGEDALARDMTQRLWVMGFTVKLAFANTVGAALAMTRCGAETVTMLPPDHGNEMLDGLPAEALRLQDDVLILLKRLGLKYVGDIRKIPRASLERRFRETGASKNKTSRLQANSTHMAQSVQWRLDQLSGAIAEPLTYIREPARFRATKPCPDLALQHEAVGLALDELLPDLCAQLARQNLGARQFQLYGFRADGGYGYTGVKLSQADHDEKTVRRLFTDKLDRIDCGYGIDLFVLEALGMEPRQSAQTDMAGSGQGGIFSPSIFRFADTLDNRLGHETVMRFMPRYSHIPERSQRKIRLTDAVDWSTWDNQQPIWSPRPVRLFNHPEPARVTAELPDSPPMQFVWRRILRKILRARGPERILPEWWTDNLKLRKSAVFRDYYDVEDTDGIRYWIFRSVKDAPMEDRTQTMRRIDWFVHGLF